MAEGIELTSVNTRFYCYRCDQPFTILSSSELKCPECLTGFIEEVPEEDDYEDESDTDENELNVFNLLDVESLLRRTVVNLEEIDSLRHSETTDLEPDEIDSFEGEPVGEVYNARSFIEGLEESLMQGPHTRLRNLDYLFDEDIDALSALLFNEAEILGPSPLPVSKIKLLPVIAVSKEHVEKGVQCTICMEDFAVREKAKNLPCDHFYHEKCITPWLERHATCPNCRKSVEVEAQSKHRRSQSCPRSHSSESRRRLFSEPRQSLGTIFTASINPFRFL